MEVQRKSMLNLTSQGVLKQSAEQDPNLSEEERQNKLLADQRLADMEKLFDAWESQKEKVFDSHMITQKRESLKRKSNMRRQNSDNQTPTGGSDVPATDRGLGSSRDFGV